MMSDQFWMQQALDASQQGLGRVNPNPLVGAVIVSPQNQHIATGYHAAYGTRHAEIMAFDLADDAGSSCRGATLYVTLEPCSHYGKTPPCADAVIARGIARCVIGCLDPNPQVAGQGVKKLQQAGIEVQVGVLQEACIANNAVFFKYIQQRIPYIFLKCALTIDGKIASRSGKSRWITSEDSRAKVQYYRQKFMAIMVGKNTVIQDNPALTCHTDASYNPIRLIFDADLTLDERYHIISDNHDKKTILLVHAVAKGDTMRWQKLRYLKKNYGVQFLFIHSSPFDWQEILTRLGQLGIDSILVEGGSRIVSQLLNQQLVDAGEFFIAPKIMGDAQAIPLCDGMSPDSPNQALSLGAVSYHTYGTDLGIQFILKHYGGATCLQD
jgi:diaminohydroxyphosphoribosylaminopyrimidine deaminase/5-amino-6-(5-phosphoribosylamino)uracil reductase